MQKRADLSKQVSLVIVTKDKKERLKQTLISLLNLPQLFPIIVVDNHSSDDTFWQIKNEFPIVEVIRLNENFGFQAANFGVSLARTPLVICSNDELTLDPKVFEQAIKLFRQYPNIGLVQTCRKEELIVKKRVFLKAGGFAI